MVNPLENRPLKLHAQPKRVTSFEVRDFRGKSISLKAYKDHVLLIVNVASRCGWTPQYHGLQSLFEKFHLSGFDVLGFPCNQFGNQEPGANSQIQAFCKTQYGVTFPIYEKIDVNGPRAHPLFHFLKSSCPGLLGIRSIKWNFTKFLVNRQGQPVARFAPWVTPEKLQPKIESLLSGESV